MTHHPECASAFDSATADAATALHDPLVATVLTDLHRTATEHDAEVMPDVWSAAAERGATDERGVADLLAHAYLPVDDTNGRLLHVLARARRPGRIVEFGTSMGISTIYLAAALETDEPPLVTTELEAAKADAARANLARAGLAERVDVWVGDALDTLSDLDEPVSLLFLDGWKGLYLSVLRLVEPMLVNGALVIADDTTLLGDLCQPFLDHVRRPGSGYVSVALPVDDGLELCCRIVR